MFNSAISGISATGATVSKVRPWPAWTSSPAASSGSRTVAQADEFTVVGAGIAAQRSLAIGPGVQFNDRSAESSGGLDLMGIRVNEQRHADARIDQRRDERAERVALSCHVEPALGGEFGAALGHDAAGMRQMAQRDVAHFLRGSHFEIERQRHA